MEISEFLDKEVYPYLDRAKVVSQLNPTDKGAYYQCTCPRCGERRAFIYKTGFALKCNRTNDCGFTETIVELVSGKLDPRGDAFVAAARELASLVGTALPKTATNDKSFEQYRRESTLEALYTRFQAAITDDTKAYLQQRGFTKHITFGTFVADTITFDEARAAGFTVTLHDGKEVINRSWEGRLVLPIRDKHGRLKGVIGRDTSGQSEKKYLYTKGLELSAIGLVGLDQAGSDIVVVEGVIDVFKARDRGIYNVCAIGGNGTAMAGSRWTLLHQLGVHRVTLMLDADKAGQDGTLKAITNAATAAACPEIFVIRPDFGGVKDLDEFLDVHSVEEYEEVVAKRQHQDSYRAAAIAERYELDTQEGKVGYLEECWKLYTEAPNERRKHQLHEYFMPTAMELSQTSPDVFADWLSAIDERVQRERAEHQLKDLTVRVSEAIQRGGFTEGYETLIQQIENLERAQARQYIEPVTTVFEEFNYYHQAVERFTGKEFIGLVQQTLPTLDSATLGLRGLTILGAQSGVGKTSMALQIGMDVVAASEDVCVVYYSGEMTRKELTLRMLSRLMNMEWKDYVRFASPEERTESFRRLVPYGKRMMILDEFNCPLPSVESLLRHCRNHKKTTGCKRVMLVVDYFQIFPLPEYMLARLSELEQDNERIKIFKQLKSALDGDPVFVITEARKPDRAAQWVVSTADFKGSGRIGYGADVALLYNPFTDSELITSIAIDTKPTEKGLVEYLYDRNSDEEPELKKPERDKLIKKLRKFMKRVGVDFGTLEVAKARDGGTRDSMVITNWYHKTQMLEGIRL